MTKLESAETIESKVGTRRHDTDHIARAVSQEQRVYILHSKECVSQGKDLRLCEFSVALDYGIDLEVWNRFQDQPVQIVIDKELGDIVPVIYEDEE